MVLVPATQGAGPDATRTVYQMRRPASEDGAMDSTTSNPIMARCGRTAPHGGHWDHTNGRPCAGNLNIVTAVVSPMVSPKPKRTVIAQGTPAERIVDIEPTGKTDILGNPIYRVKP